MSNQISNNNISKNRLDWSAALVFTGLAFSSQCGGGFASGGTPMTYFLSKGYPGIFMPLIVALINGFILYFSMKYAMDFKLYDYNSFLTKYTGKYNRFFRGIYEFNYNWLLIVVMALAYSTSGGVIADLTGLPYILTTFIIAIIMYFLVTNGTGVVRKNAVVMSIIILIALIAVHVPNVFYNAHKIAANAAALKSENVTLKTWAIALLWGYIFSGQNLAGFGAYINHADIFVSKKGLKRGVILSVIANFIALVLVNLNLLANLDLYRASNPKPNIPVLMVVKNGFGMEGLLSFMLSVAIFFSAISTAINYIHGFNDRVLNYISSRNKESEKVKEQKKHKRVVKITIGYIIITWAVSQVGLTNLIAKGLTFSALLTLICFILPTIYNALKGWNKAEKEIEFEAIKDF
ncbi:hypothetical protein M2651_07795 [Clostridium sp. SYSU_GA19001]|uniref:hypothetical protein n=1 Tax=Clostridium caldaquaticum TaxID=2940653 RepID=UPI002076E81E|nr:hypothetical protein [Clostridium caldaquaticum]MCM8710927.1 hypothetical protein [Clostridium caldaquaticum]